VKPKPLLTTIELLCRLISLSRFGFLKVSDFMIVFTNIKRYSKVTYTSTKYIEQKVNLSFSKHNS